MLLCAFLLPGSALAAELTEALGLSFVDGSVNTLGASMDGAPMPRLTRDALRIAVDAPTTDVPVRQWHHVQAETLPRSLRGSNTALYAKLNGAGEIVQIVLRLATGCGTTTDRLADLISKKYSIEPQSVLITSELAPARIWKFDQRRAVLLCADDEGWLAYLDPQRMQDAQRAYRAELKAGEQTRKLSHVVRANRLVRGDRRGIDSAFGIPFGAPVATADGAPLPIDEPATFEPLVADSKVTRYEVTVSPEQTPIRLSASVQEYTIDEVAPWFEAKFGTPRKRTDKHIIHKAANDFAVLRQTGGTLEFVFIDGAAQQAMRARKRAADEADWQDEVEGL